MKTFLVILLLVTGNTIFAQKPVKKETAPVNKVADKNSIERKRYPARELPDAKIPGTDDDSQVKEKLIALALKNPAMKEVEANISIAGINRKKANSTVLNSIRVGGNINEFVVNNSPASNFYPKYNLGILMPLDMFAIGKAAKRTADQQIIIGNSQKAQLEKSIIASVLIQYETYKEKKELVELQKISLEEDIAAYQRAQNDFKDDTISLEDLNKIYKVYVAENANLITKQKDLNIAILQMEEQIGVPLEEALQK